MGFALLCIITCLAAFLLFQIELILGKLLLPQYGGSFLVWGACVVFFQGVLLAGYIAAHHFITHLGIKKYLNLHLLLLFLPLLFFPGRALVLAVEDSNQLPLVIDIFWRLLVSIGPVFFVLSTVSLVTQSWLSQSALPQRHHPYTLYAVSNVGSFLALLTYPFIVEPVWGLSDQLMFWRCAFLVLIVLSVLGWFKIKTTAVDNVLTVSSLSPLSIPKKTQLMWLLLSAAGVVMFLSVTNIITYEIAPLPLLWIIPLGIYLMTFVLNFSSKPSEPTWFDNNAGTIIGLNLAAFFLVMKTMVPTIIMVIIVCALLFFLCMFTQRALIQTKPEDNRLLTRFYVIISLGGFIGGILATWIIPLVSTMLLEFLVGLLLIALSAPYQKRPLDWKIVLGVVLACLVLIVWPVYVKKYSLVGIILLITGSYLGFRLLAGSRIVLSSVLVLIILFAPWLEARWKDVKFIDKHRNYYGVYQIYDKHNIRLMLHGTTLHGVELNDPKGGLLPIGYYSPVSAVGGVILKDYFEVKRLGVVGLGVGTLVMYAKPNMPIDVFELDTDVLSLAKKDFNYVNNAPGPVQYIIGDARVSLNKIPSATYDLLIIDAFGGDAIPVHLINSNVISIYRDKITPHGGILFHITNRYIELKPLMANVARELGAWVAVKEVPDGGVNMRSIWVVMTWDQERLIKLMTEDNWQVISSNEFKPLRSWSDDYSSVLPMLKLEEFISSVKHFKWWSF